jgi:hypothetical protein
MDPEFVAPATPTESTPVETPPEPSIADHEATYGKGAKTAVEPEMPLAERPRHRAKSQQATPRDLEDIATFTKRLREAEEAIPIERKDGESDRVYQLRRRAEIAELAKTYKTTPTHVPSKAEPIAVPAPRAAVPPSAGTFAEVEPTLDQFQDKPDPYAAWMRASIAYDRRKEAWEENQTNSQKAIVERDRQMVAAHQQRMQTAVQTRPDFQATVAPLLDRKLPNPLLKAIAMHEQGPDFVYTLAKDPDLLDDLFVAAYGKDPTDDDFVATLQRRLLKHVQPAGTTGSVAAPPPRIAPRPPNPVRTGPLMTGDDLPGDDASIAEHERVFGRKRRR